jgi:hypothetical protein
MHVLSDETGPWTPVFRTHSQYEWIQASSGFGNARGCCFWCSKNINCSISESISKFHDIMAAARSDKILVRGYVSTVLGCPYSGRVDPQLVVDVASRLMDMCVLNF